MAMFGMVVKKPCQKIVTKFGIVLKKLCQDIFVTIAVIFWSFLVWVDLMFWSSSSLIYLDNAYQVVWRMLEPSSCHFRLKLVSVRPHECWHNMANRSCWYTVDQTDLHGGCAAMCAARTLSHIAWLGGLCGHMCGLYSRAHRLAWRLSNHARAHIRGHTTLDLRAFCVFFSSPKPLLCPYSLFFPHFFGHLLEEERTLDDPPLPLGELKLQP